jgi:Alginate lyase
MKLPNVRPTLAALLVAAAALPVAPAAGRAQFVGIAPRNRENGEPRVSLWRPENLVDSRARARDGDKRLRAAFAQLERDANAALRVGPFSVMDKKRVAPSGDKHDFVSVAPEWWPDSTKPGGTPYVQRVGEPNPESLVDSDAASFTRMVDAVETLALGAWFLGDQRYAERAATLLRTWFLDKRTRMNPNLNYAHAVPGVTDGRGVGITDARDLARVVDAVGLLEGATAWSERDQRDMMAWARDYLAWLVTSPHGVEARAEKGGVGTWYDAQVASLALFVGDTGLVRRTIAQSAAPRLASQMAPDGALTIERAGPRPVQHTLQTLDAFERLAEVGRQVGADFWRWQAPNGASLQQAARNVAQFTTTAAATPTTDAAPAEFLVPLRRAVQVFGDPVVAAAIEKLPPKLIESDRSRLLFPDVP